MDAVPKIASDAVRYDAEAHAYYIGKKRLISVGTVLKRAATAFNPWAKDDIDDAARARMERGKMIHEAFDAYDDKTLDVAGWIAANTEHKPERMIERYDAALKEIGVSAWDDHEKPRHHPRGTYWGIIDRVKREYGVWELKSGTSAPSSYRVQVALYCMIWGEKQGGIIHLEGDGPVIERITTKDFRLAELALELAATAKAR
jgi:hypothetical protein